MNDWPDGYLVTVAYQLVRRLDWERITVADATLARADFTSVFDALRVHGIEPTSDGPDELTYSGTAVKAAVQPLLARLRALVARVRAAGAVAFAAPGDLPERLHCTLDHPREFFGVPDGPLDRVEIINFTDMPEHDLRWLARSRVGECGALRMLKLVSVHLSSFPLDIELGRLTKLVALNLDANKLAALPPEISAARSLEWLSLNENPLTAEGLEPLRALPRLRYLGLIRTAARSELDRVRALVPEQCVIQYVAG